MFNNLLESKPKKQRSPAGAAVSIILHSILIGGAVYATAHAAIENEKPKQEEVKFVETPRSRRRPSPRSRSRRRRTWSPRRRRRRASRC